MKPSNKIRQGLRQNWAVGLTVLLLLMAVYAAVQLLELPERILTAVDISAHTKLEIARQAAQHAYWATAAVFGMTALLIWLLIQIRAQEAQTRIIYVDRPKEMTHTGEQENQNRSQHQQRLDLLEKQCQSENLHQVLLHLCKTLEAGAAALYASRHEAKKRYIEVIDGYAFTFPDSQPLSYEYGEGFAGQVAKTGVRMLIDRVPEGHIRVFSGLGGASPSFLAVLPLKNAASEVSGVLEIALFHPLNSDDIELLDLAARWLSQHLTVSTTA